MQSLPLSTFNSKKVGMMLHVSNAPLIGRGDKLENFDLNFFPTSKTWKGLPTTT